jgi:hypothetical protein
MACAYVFALIALMDAIKAGRPAMISWIAQTFLQLVLLSIIMVGQSVQSAVSNARAAKEFTDTGTILDRLDVNTAGGIKDVLDAIHAIGKTPSAPRSDPCSGTSPTDYDKNGPVRLVAVGERRRA